MKNNFMKTKQTKDRHENNSNLGTSAENFNKIRSRSHSPNVPIKQTSEKLGEVPMSYSKNIENNGRGGKDKILNLKNKK